MLEGNLRVRGGTRDSRRLHRFLNRLDQRISVPTYRSAFIRDEELSREVSRLNSSGLLFLRWSAQHAGAVGTNPGALMKADPWKWSIYERAWAIVLIRDAFWVSLKKAHMLKYGWIRRGEVPWGEGGGGENFLEALQSLVHKPIDEYLLSLCVKECKIMSFFYYK